MPSRQMTPRAILVLAVLSFIPVVAGPGNGHSNDKAKLLKELAKVEKDLAREEARLKKKKAAIEGEYVRLMKPVVRKKLTTKVRSIGSRWAGALTGADKREATRQIKKELRTALKDVIGANMAPILATDLTSNLVDRVSGVDKVDAEGAVNTTIEDLFPTGKFESDFEVVQDELFKRYNRLKSKRDTLKVQLDEIERREQALKSGVPTGMLRVPAGTHRIGLNDADISKTIKAVGRKPEGAIHWWVGSPAHQIELDEFYIDVNEVTNRWYLEFLKDKEHLAALKSADDYDARVPRYWKDGMYPEGWDNRPVTDVSHNDAVLFARWMGRRLPTEYEWESAARYTKEKNDLRIWPWGTDWSVRQIRCNNDLAIEHPGRRSIPYTLPPLLDVGSFPEGRSELGGNDFAGNAYEITSSPYSPYPGFKTKKIKRSRLSSSDFNSEQIVLRGGDCQKADLVVSTTWRRGLPRTGRALWVGFRTAGSATRGMDHVEALTEGGAQKRYLVDYEPLPSDITSRRQYAGLATEAPGRYSSIMSGGINPETRLPTKARYITVINRLANDFRNHAALKAIAKAQKGPVMVGFLHLGVPSVEPKLEPGNYMICWENTSIPEPEEPPKDEAEDKASKGKKASRGKKGKQEEPEPIPEAFTFVKLGGRRQEPVRVTKFLPPVVAASQPTRVIPNHETDTVDLAMAFPIKFQKSNAFVVTLQLKLEPGQAKNFK